MAEDGAGWSVGVLIKERRLAEGLTQVQAAERAGVSVGTWRSAESGQRRPRPENFHAMLDSLGLTPEDVHEAAVRAAPIYLDLDAARHELQRLCAEELPDELVDALLRVVRLALVGYEDEVLHGEHPDTTGHGRR